jgi:hypothetical protein
MSHSSYLLLPLTHNFNSSIELTVAGEGREEEREEERERAGDKEGGGREREREICNCLQPQLPFFPFCLTH